MARLQFEPSSFLVSQPHWTMSAVPHNFIANAFPHIIKELGNWHSKGAVLQMATASVVWHWRKGHFKAAAKQKWLYSAVSFFQDTAAFPPLPIITTEDTDNLRLTGTDRMMTLMKFQQKVSARKY